MVERFLYNLGPTIGHNDFFLGIDTSKSVPVGQLRWPQADDGFWMMDSLPQKAMASFTDIFGQMTT